MIKTSNVSYAYQTGSSLQLPDVDVHAGEPCLLLGDSGSGKTTLLHLMGGLLRMQLNEAQLDHFRAKHLGFVFQRNHLIGALTVAQNIAMAPYLAGSNIEQARIDEVLEELQLKEKRNARISELSLGQAQRVAIARAVINKPALILADEPTSSLDDTNCMRAIQLLLQVAEHHQAALLVATHDQRLRNVIKQQIQLKAQNQ
jgi:ABC-type lipoprotein export system ATPase subunit